MANQEEKHGRNHKGSSAKANNVIFQHLDIKGMLNLELHLENDFLATLILSGIFCLSLEHGNNNHNYKHLIVSDYNQALY